MRAPKPLFKVGDMAHSPYFIPGAWDPLHGQSGIPGDVRVHVVEVSMQRGAMPRYKVAYPVPSSTGLWVYQDALLPI